MLNRIILIGRLTRDPEMRYVPSGHPVASFSLAVDRPFANQQGERETDFIDIVAWRKLAEQVSQHLSKGRLVAVEGRLQIRSYETQDGQKRKVAEVVADAVRFLDRKATGASTGTTEGGEFAEENEQEVPF
ncbi:MAG: single-stranded DNA-binding protein [bacterium]|nr:single-stranded DNA-binding protein [bacterium]